MRKLNSLVKSRIKNVKNPQFKLHRKYFSNYYSNHPCLTEYEINGKLEKLDIKDYYNEIIENFLTKKYSSKEEILTKLKIGTENFKNNLLIKSAFFIDDKYSDSNKNFEYTDFSEDELKRQIQYKKLDKNYIYNVLLGKDEYELINLVTRNVILNGYAIKEEDSNIFNEQRKEVENLVDIYYNGDNLTEVEKTIRLIYLSQKYKKFKYYLDHKYEDYYCKFTEKDYVNFLPISFSQELHINKSLYFSDNKFYNNYDKNLKPVDIDLLFDVSEKMKKSESNHLLRYFFLLFKNNHLLNNVVKSEMIAYCILAKINFFLQSEEFCREFDFGFDFYISHALLSFHIWLICQRLNNFKRSKNASDLVNNIIKFNKKICNTYFQDVDTLRKISKFSFIEENAEEQKKKLHWHFFIYNPTVENNFFKIDALVWTYIFREKIYRYDDRVYKMSNYIVYHFNKFKELNYNDFKNLQFEFNLDEAIPVNYRDVVKKYNPPLTQEQYFIENYNNFAYRTYVYSYKTDIERSFNNLYKTFIRYTQDQTFDKKNYMMMSRRKEDDLYDVIKDKEKINELNENLNLESNSTSISIFRNFFNMWNSKYFSKIIETCEKEDRQREMQNYDDLREIKKGVKRFSENLNQQIRKKLYVYRYNIFNHPKAEKDIYILHESKLIYPDSNVINKKRRDKNFVEKLFNL